MKSILYHGSPNIIEAPQFGKGNPNNDYGLGNEYVLNWMAVLVENRTFDLTNIIAENARIYLLENFLPEYKDAEATIYLHSKDNRNRQG